MGWRPDLDRGALRLQHPASSFSPFRPVAGRRREVANHSTMNGAFMTTFPARWSIWWTIPIRWIARTVSAAATPALAALVLDAWWPELVAPLGEPKRRLLWILAGAGAFATEELVHEWRRWRAGRPAASASASAAT